MKNTIIKNITIKKSSTSSVALATDSIDSGGTKAEPGHTPQTRDSFRHSYLAMAVRSALFSLGLATMTLPHAVLAQAGGAPAAAVRAYSISAGPMERALEEFGRQAGLKLSFDAAEVKNITTPGLTGNFSAQDGLSLLLPGADLKRLLNLVVMLSRGLQWLPSPRCCRQ